MRALYLAAALLIALPGRADAGLDGCAIVRPTSDGFLSLRQGPGVRFAEKTKLRQGDYLWVTDTNCLRQGNRTICDDTRRWLHVSSVRRLDRDRHTTMEGWVYQRHVDMTECRDDS